MKAGTVISYNIGSPESGVRELYSLFGKLPLPDMSSLVEQNATG
jgi:hypothetical protein